MINFVFTDPPEIPARAGEVYNSDKFNVLFFTVHYKEAQSMDPQCCMMLEMTCEAVVDAG